MTMDLIYEIDGRIRARISDGGEVGFYLYLYDLVSGSCTHDYLQDTLDMAQEQAEEDFSLPRDGWRQEA